MNQSKLTHALAEISNMCLDEIAMNYRLDAEHIVQMIYVETGLTNHQLNAYEHRHWNTAAHLPTPGIPLIARLHDGTEVEAVRPSYISDRGNNDLGYRSLAGEVLNVKEWSIQ